METLDFAELYAWIFIGLKVWAVMIGSMLIWTYFDS